jgi:conjugative relaxase-like TrwC/TraI family protein
MGKRSAFYYANLAQEQREFDCTESGEPPGCWEGSGAAALGLVGRIRRDDFLALFSGFSSDGQHLVQNAGDKDRVTGWDCVFAPSKSVSILWAVSDAQIQHAIEHVHHQAVVKALQYLEANSGSRRGGAGSECEKTRFVVATFQHGTNRNQEPYLHTHALVLNVSVREDDSTGAIHSKLLYQHKMAAGAIYRAELAAGLQQELGLSLEREKSWFELKGFSRQSGRYKALVNLWSSRREEIEAQHPATSAQAQVAAYQTRKEKESLPSRIALFADWQKTGTKYGFSSRHAQRLVGRGREHFSLLQKFQEWRAVREAATQVVYHQSHFTHRKMVEAIAVAAQTRGLNSTDVLRLTEKYLSSRHVIALGRIDGEERFANKRLYQLEKQLIAQAITLGRDRSVRVAGRRIEAVAARHNLTEEQQKALQFIAERGNLKVLSGISGTGKTYTLRAAREMFERSGYQVIGVSPSRRGAEKLQEKTGIGEQSALSKLFLQEKGQSMSLWQFFSQINRAEEGYRRYGRYSAAKSPFSRKTVVITDDAQAIGAGDMKRLLDEARKAGAKLILSGDLKQPQAYRHSGALGAIAQSVDTIELAEVQRQEAVWARDVVRNIAEGRSRTALETLAQKGLLTIALTQEEAMDTLVKQWSERGVMRPQDHLMVTDNPSEARILNHLAQSKMKDAEVLGKTSVRVGTEHIHSGERIIFRETDFTYGITKGALGTVTKIEPLTKIALVELDDGKSRLINFRHFKAIDLAYAVPTTDTRNIEAYHVYVFTQGIGQDKALVQMSRAKVSTRVYSYMSKQEQETMNPYYKMSTRMALQKEDRFASRLHQHVQEQERSR